jgi:hypothetical protein
MPSLMPTYKGFFQRSAACHHRLYWGAKNKIPIYQVNVNFSKILTVKGTIQNVSNVV